MSSMRIDSTLDNSFADGKSRPHLRRDTVLACPVR